MNLFYRLLIFTVSFLSPVILFSQVNSVLTTTVGGNGQDGCVFEITALTTVEIQKLWFVADAGTGNYEIYYNPNGMGSPSPATFPQWTLLAGPTSITTSGPNALTEFPVQLSLLMNAGETFGFYVTADASGPNLDYTNGPFPNATIPVHPITDGNISVDINGFGLAYQFTGTAFTPRGYNGQIDYIIPSFSPDDAGITSIDSPTVFCAGTENVYATVKNFGTSPLDSVTINWSIDGTLQSAINFTTQLDTFGGTNPNEASVLLGSIVFAPNTPYDIEVWTSNPNGQMDTVNFNDTASATLQAAIQGNFTIGGVGANYPDFTSAANDLNLFGICGPVNFTVNPGTYNEFLNLSAIDGASSTNTITFDGGDTSLVTLSHDASAQNATIWLNGVDWTTIKNMRIESTSTGFDSWGILLNNEANHNTIDSCSIVLPISSNDDRSGILASSSETTDFGEGNNANYTTVSNCVISGGDRNITFEGGTTGNWTVGNRFINNTLQFADDYGFYGDEQDSLVFQGNVIKNIQQAVNGDGFYSFDFENLTLRENIINAPDWAVYCADLNVAGIGGRSVIANNYVTSNNDYGVYVIDGENIDIFHNTVFGEPAIYLDYSFDGLDSIDVRNNIFISNNDNAFEIDLNTGFNGVSALDNNIYNTNGTAFAFWEGTAYPDLASWQTALTQYNVNSFEGDPIFFAPGDFHVVGPLANNQGSPTNILIDLDGDSRSASTPDIGADEYSLLPDDVGVVSIDSPTVFCPGSFDVYATLANFGTNQISSATVNWSVDGVLQSTVNFSGLLDTLGGTGSRFGQILLGNFNFTTSNPYIVEAWATNPNGQSDPNSTNDSVIAVVASNLPAPTGIMTTQLSATQATFTWTGGSANSWLWVNVPAGNPLVGQGTPVTSATAVVTGLTSETDYDFYVREVCPTGDTSLWAGPFSYKTLFLCPPNSVCFLTGGQEGRTGPSQAQINSIYAGTPLDGNVVSNNGVQAWTVQNSGLYRVQAFGAEGGGSALRPGGKGAHITGEILLSAGQTVNIVVGQTGFITPSTTPSGNRGGGGGTFVWDAANTTQPLIVAGGGGGSNVSVTSAGQGQDGSAGPDGTALANGAGSPGTNGNGAAPGGAGFLTDPTGGLATNGIQPLSALNGAVGGEGYTPTSHFGGFGGGGGGGGSPSTTYASGGGGGYSGGAGQDGIPNASEGGGGGGSFNSGSNPVNVAGVRTGAGLVIFEALTSGVANDVGISGVSPNNIVCSGDYDITVTALNFGITQINNFDLNWSWNGVIQPTVPITSLLDTFGGSGTSSTQINLGTQNIAGPNTLVVWTSNPNGGADGLSSNDSLTISFNPSFISAEITSVTSGEICGSGPVTLSATFTGSVLNWYDDPGLTNVVNTGTTYTLSVSQTETFYLQAENAGNSCSSEVDTAIAEVNFTPTVNFTSAINNCTVDFTSLVSSNTDSVRWVFGDGIGTSNQLNPTYTYSNAQSYLIKLTAFDGTCFKDTTKALFVNCQVGLRSNSWSEEINLYPNPSKGQVSLEVPFAEKQVLISVIDIKGQEVFRQEYDSDITFKKVIDLSYLDAGSYFVNIYSGDRSAVKKLTIK